MKLEHRGQAFTLVELLVVIAIIGVLAAALTPNLLETRRYSHEGAAVAYLRHCVTAVESSRDVVTQKLPDVSSCEDPMLGEARLNPPTSVKDTAITVQEDRDSYMITVRSVSGKVFRHNGKTVVAGG